MTREGDILAVPAFLRTRYGLKGSELLAAAVIWGNIGQGMYEGTTTAVVDWCGLHPLRANEALKRLERKGIIRKRGDGYEGYELVPDAPVRPCSAQAERLLEWIRKNAPTVASMADPLTGEQADRLLKNNSVERLQEVFGNMHNWRDLCKKNRSAFITVLAWIKGDAHGFRKTKTEREIEQRLHVPDYDYGDDAEY